ncbi:Serine protease snake [Papilio xuthus]|uniref:Serine protease snake n=1 Tax=Papilio xuthus TaxID=66420 RepID=A0A194Q2Q3_PAPXU|nr:Serine protease snake [Papilio xuthus]
MARSTIFAAVFYIILSTGAYAQFYDFLEALQPLVKSYPSFGDFPTYDNIFTTKKPKTFNRNPTNQRTEEKKERRKTPAAISTLESYLRDDARKKEKIGQDVSTTFKPVNKNTNHRNDNQNKPTNIRNSSRNTAREIHSSSKENSRSTSRNNNDPLSVHDNNNEKRKHNDDKISFITRTTKRYETTTKRNSQSSENYEKQNNYNIQSNNNKNNNNNYNSNENIHFPNNEQDNRPSNNQPFKSLTQSNEYVSQSTNRGSNRQNNQGNNRPYNNQNTQSGEYSTINKISKNYVLTTQNPFYNRPGVRPAVVDDKRPPITNRPPSRRTTTLKPVHVLPKDTRIPPELITVPGEDAMSEAERLRHIDVSERMCSKYKKLYTKQLQAIPLVPSPEPLEINVTSCAPSKIPLIVGGKVVSIKDFPHMALIGWVKLNYDGYAWRCGGSLISDRFVLTAAHCAYEERDNSIVMGPPRAVQLGSSYLDDPNAVVMKISTVIRHPRYKLPKAYYDIALIKMSDAVTFSEFIRPACLGVPPTPNESFIATGWGRTEFGGDLSRELRSVSLDVWEPVDCIRALGKSRKLPNGPSSDSQLCAGVREGGKDTCQGDSGGPAQIQDGCVWRVVAVTSVGRSCGAPNTPALYAIAHRAFISSVVYSEQSLSSEIDQIDLNEQGYHPSRSTETFNYQNNNWKSQQRNENVRNHENTRSVGNNYNYNQQSNDYTNNYEAYNQPYYNDAPTWF